MARHNFLVRHKPRSGCNADIIESGTKVTCWIGILLKDTTNICWKMLYYALIDLAPPAGNRKYNA